VNQDTRVRQRETLFGSTSGKKDSRNGCRLANAGRDHIRLDELHGVVDRKAGRDRAARRIYVQLNVFLRVLSLEEEHLRGGQVGDMVVNRRADEDDVFLSSRE
jgi:hypothetical protein